jgi:hypothetical protein
MLNISIPKDQWILSRLAKKPTLGSVRRSRSILISAKKNETKHSRGCSLDESGVRYVGLRCAFRLPRL